MTFKELELIEPLLKAIEENGYNQPTKIQKYTIPVVLQKRDILGIARTGTGKTAAFALPIIQNLSIDNKRGYNKKIEALILTPTRELAIQVNECITNYCKYTDLKSCAIFGGVKQHTQTEKLKRGINILVATPGRLLDLMNQRLVSLSDIKYFVLDEADRMLDMGFIHDIKKVISLLPSKRQTLLFSATMPKDISILSGTLLKNPERIEVSPVSSVVDTVKQHVYMVEKIKRKEILKKIIREKEEQSVLIFSRTKHGADKLARYLSREGIKSEAIHGDKSQANRQRTLTGFKSGKIRVMVATDIAARGIDIQELEMVVNYDLPDCPETYVHRIGRTGRAGRAGTALSFCSQEEYPLLKSIQKLTGKKIQPESITA